MQLKDYVRPSEVLKALQQASVKDLYPSACYYIEPRDAAASVAYPIGTYEAHLSREPFEGLIPPHQIKVIRKKKEKLLRVADYLLGEMDLQGSCVRFELEAKPTGSLRPDLLLQACIEDEQRRLFLTQEDASALKLLSLTRIDQRAAL